MIQNGNVAQPGWLAALVLAAVLVLAACGGGETPANTGGYGSAGTAAEDAAGDAPTEAAATDADEAAPGEPTDTLQISTAGEQLRFDKEELGPVPAGESVTLTFDNSSRANPHNWILLDTSSQEAAAEFNSVGQTTGPDANYMPEDDSLVLANTALLQPTEVGEVTFEAPPPGEYIYVCTVPGHYAAGMRGVLTVVDE
jgi:azurin